MTCLICRRLFPVAFVGLSLLASGCGPGSQTGQNGKTPNSGSASAKDADFANKAAVAGMAEVELAKIALKKTSNADVKHFAEHMVEDHTKANKELASLAKKKEMQVPDKLDKQHQDVVDRLAKLDGEEFDKEYAKVQVDDHVKAVELFETESKNGADADFKAFAAKTLPTLQEHLKMARDLAAGKKVQD